MSLFKAYVTAEGKTHTIMLPDLTLEQLKQQLLQLTQSTQADDIFTIVDRSGNRIDTDKDVVHAFESSPVDFTVQFRSSLVFMFYYFYFAPKNKERIDEYEIKDISNVNGLEQSIMKKDIIPEALDFKKHWSMYWRQSNVEAAKTVEQMMHDNQQGLIIVACNTLKWKNRNGGFSSIINVIKNSNKDNTKEFGEYCVYVIKRKSIILEQVNIDGNIYVVDCKFGCKVYMNITTQLFVTKDAVIDEQIKQHINPIPWNTKIHHDIPLQFHNLETKKEICIKQNLIDESIIHLQEYLQIAMNMFGFNHHYIAIAYNLLGNVYSNNKEQPDKAIELFEKALHIILHIFGINNDFVASIYTNLGIAYEKKSIYDKAIECYEKALTIFSNTNKITADSFWNLALIFAKLGDNKTACRYFEEAWKIYSTIFGEWNRESLRAKWKVEKLSE
ncbi:hypothetical protein RFI_22327 [Reticulomyxa filosa]|uniref:Uncharacterized protein n=1 Tax=Reticulomyxa filosa TaxID=46433 RepID=X6MMZ7_RETFI|nr:hypothetical protein RFI_22327 [Reticulomyxa filosa]|eukprot:ETO15036.1 hypothetical protein RFI_22327 [Reticulomyxa filosa]